MKISPLLCLAMSCLFVACERPMNMAAQDARAELRSSIEFAKRRSDSYEFTNPAGDVVATVSGPQLLAIAPNRKAGIAAHTTGHRSMQFEMVDADSERAPVITLPLDSAHGPKIIWSSPDGRTFLWLGNGTLRFFSRCGNAFHEETVADHDVTAAAAGNEAIVFAQNRELFTKNLRSRSVERMIELPARADLIAVRPDGSEVYVVSNGESRQPLVWRIIDGRLQPIPLTLHGVVHALIPLRGTPEVVVEAWRGRERIDGTQMHEFFLWNHQTATLTLFLRNQSDYRLHVPAQLVPVISPSCDTAGSSSAG